MAGLAATFGSGAMTNAVDEIEGTEVILVIGSNTTSQHPLIGARIINAVERGARLILIDPRQIPLARFAQFHLRHNIGTDVAVLNGLMHVIIRDGLFRSDFIAARTEGFEDLKRVVERYTPQVVEMISGVSARDLEQVACLLAGADRAMLFYAMGITQHISGTDNVKSCANLAMLTGNVGRPGTGVNPLRGQNNVQGACDMGALPVVYSGYQRVSDPAVRDKFAQAWGVADLDDKPGLTITDMLEAASEGRLRGLYVMGENPMLSDPDLGHVELALSSLELLVVQDIFLTESARMADVVLPGACFAEKEGTYTNTERRVQYASRALLPPGSCRSDMEIIAEISRRAGYPQPTCSPRAVWEEIRAVTPSYAGITYDRLATGHGLQWPCPTPEHPGTPFLHRDSFAKGKGTFLPCEFTPVQEAPDEEYDLLLTTGRVASHFHTGTMTRRSPLLERESPRNTLEINPEDARRLGIGERDTVEVSSRRGSVHLEAEITPRVPRRVVFSTFHFAESPINLLTNPACDPVSKIPEFKGCAVKVRRCP